ncbi:amidohydrolase family protein [Luteimonas kalidii]|uniref:Amidohydrolase family protein n=1 Tax=Luteimonas kalidii TaxID=3042025 RepID=A0ABT6JQT3_9GAMM|nr:amidohydrolase family protein [Luteimonas kalidii]MDH5832843.1 amidohydrolase family protein [Luteimonas kalidii]
MIHSLLFIRLVCLCCLAFLSGGAFAQSPAVPPKDTTAFVRVNVLPMDRERVLRDQVVLVEDGHIAAIGRALAVPEGARIVDGEGSAWLLPGLADMHNHVDGLQDLDLQLALGITTTLHMGEARNSFVGRTRAAIANGERAGPRAFVALAVDGSPRYGHLVVADVDDARAAVRVARSNGYDFIKVYNNLPADAFSALLQEARVHGIPVVGHGVADVGLERQLESGQALVAHAEEFFYTFFPQPAGDDPNAAPDDREIEAAIGLLRRHGTAVVADLVTYETIARQWGRPDVVDAFLRAPESRYLHPALRVSWPLQGYARRSGSLQARAGFLRRFVKAMDEAGVPLLSGTDAPDIPGLVPGFALHRNLAALVEAGLSPHAALATATRVPGDFIRRTRPGLPAFGVVAEGARADLLLVADDPLADLSTLASPMGVMADGRWYPRADLEARRDKIRAAYAQAASTALDASAADR